MDIEKLLSCIAGGFMGIAFGTVFLMHYLQFQKLLDKIARMGEETFGEIISIELERGTGRYHQRYHHLVRIVFTADGETVVPPAFTVSLHSGYYIGQQVYVQYFKYNPEECLIKENPNSSWYLNRWSAFGGTLGLLLAAGFYSMTLIAIAAVFM